jgi:four helix bundle protein
MEKGYKKLLVWQKSIELVIEMYSLTDTFPKNEQFGLTSQMRRAAVSVPANIAEGSRRMTEKDSAHFYTIAFGSGAELETLIEIARRLPFASTFSFQKIDNLLDEIMRMLNKLVKVSR